MSLLNKKFGLSYEKYHVQIMQGEFIYLSVLNFKLNKKNFMHLGSFSEH